MLAVCLFCLWVLKFPDPINRNVINAVDIDRFSRVGLAEDQSIHQIAEALCEIGSGNYLNDLQIKLNRAIVVGLGSKMPAPSVIFYDDDDDFARGYFNSELWLIRLNSNLISRDRLITLLSVLTHEIRHAEQKYFAIKYHIEVGHPKEYIQSVMFAPIHIIQSASDRGEKVDADEFSFGEYISKTIFDETLVEKTAHFMSLLEETKGTKQYKAHQWQFAKDIPIERDAYSFQRIITPAIKDCLSRQSK